MAEALGNQLPSGYDEDFVNAVEDEHFCLKCHLTLKEPTLTRCGHRFCKECLEDHFRRQDARGERLTCPADREGLDRDRDVFPDKAIERKILSFAIKCPSDGCEWTGELRNKENHLTTCQYKVIPCTNENCQVSLQRRYLENHVTVTCQWRILNCVYCSKPHPECHMTAHTNQCSKFPVNCPNSCGFSIPREMIPSHTEDECPLTIICCPYVKMGCETKVERQAVESHLQSATRIHLDLACIKLNDTEKELNATKGQLNNTKETTKKLKKELETLQRQFEEKAIEDQKKTGSREKTVMMKQDYPFFPFLFIWKIENFSKLLEVAKDGKNPGVCSASFYTDDYGYKLRVQMYPNGIFLPRNEYLSVFIQIMKGEYDAILPWPFNRIVKFTLIDQQEDPEKRKNVTAAVIPDNDPLCYARPKTENNSVHGKPKFISHEQLHSRRYVVDDSLFLQVEVGLPMK